MLRAKLSNENLVLDSQQEPEAAAKAAGLRYVTDRIPGIRRVKKGHGFSYVDAKGAIVRDEKALARIRSLAIPPAWTDVWICSSENGHLQATGKDAKHRKQYRYHPQWNHIRNETKFSKMLLFSEKLPQIREQVKKDLQKEGMVRERVLAAIIEIMEQTMIRIGNDEYAEKNNSYGLTTIRNHHVDVKGKKIRFRFKGKSGKLHDVEIEDRRLAEIVRKSQELPGQELFAYETDEGSYIDVTSQDVNQYLKEITGEDITAKDFRTWGGTVQAAVQLAEMGPCQTKKELKSQILRAVEGTAEKLRNTPSICRKYYIHPCVLEAYENGSIFKIKASCENKNRKKGSGLYPEEHFAVELLKQSARES